jgi:hypothetical protein
MFDDRSGCQSTASQSQNYEVNVSRMDTSVMWSATMRLLPDIQRVSNVWMQGQDTIVIPASDAEEGVSYPWARYVLQGSMKLCKELKTVKSACRVKFDCSSANCWAQSWMMQLQGQSIWGYIDWLRKTIVISTVLLMVMQGIQVLSARVWALNRCQPTRLKMLQITGVYDARTAWVSVMSQVNNLMWFCFDLYWWTSRM